MENADISPMHSALSRKHGASSARSFAYRAVHIAVPVVVTVFVVWVVGAGDVVTRLRTADPVWIVAALVACSAQVVLCAVRWRVTAARLATRMTYRGAIAEYYLSSVINTTVPGGVVGDALRAVRSRGAAGLERAAQSVVIERLAGQIALGATLLLGLALSGQAELQWISLLALAAVAALGAAFWFARRRPALARLVPPFLQRFATAVRDSWFGMRAALSQVSLSLLVVVANLAAFSFAARATGATLPFPELLYAVPLVLVAMLIPFSVAGWGYREGAAAAVFPMIGASAAEGVATSVVFGAVLLVSSLPGLAVLLSRKDALGGDGSGEAGAAAAPSGNGSERDG